jgi:hypothetical protein
MGRSDEEHTRQLAGAGNRWRRRPAGGVGTGRSFVPLVRLAGEWDATVGHQPEQSGQRLTWPAWGSRLSEATARAAPLYVGASSLQTPATEPVKIHEEDAGMIHSHLCAGRPVSSSSVDTAVPRARERRTVR